ncbi:MAG: hypothetical protein HYR95_01475 [Candidatus Colwellbacteria bacterium]|nr:hypothetical protein [Candidatus Colwellbacteria bacterium]
MSVKKLMPGQRVLFVSSRDDARQNPGNVEQNEELFNLVPEGVQKELIIYEHAGHGTTMLESTEKPDLMETITRFIQNG